MPCEMCGKEVPRLRTAQIGGSIHEVCNDCAKFREEIPPEAPKAAPVATGPAAVASPPPRIAPIHHGPKKEVLSRGEMELAFRMPTSPWVAVTGRHGKSTTVTLLDLMASRGGCGVGKVISN